MGARAKYGLVVQRMFECARRVRAQHLGDDQSIALIPTCIFALCLLMVFIGAERPQRLGGVKVVDHASLGSIFIPPALTTLVAVVRFSDSHDDGVEPMEFIVVGSWSKDKGC